MSQNPYATYGMPDESVPARTSVLAILSLVSSLICCIPGLGALGAVLGGLSLIRIGSSNGRRTGKGLAITGIVIGLIVSILWVFIFIGASATMAQAAKIFQPMVQAATAPDAATLRAKVSPTLANVLTDADFANFKAKIDAEIGAVQPPPTGMIAFFKQYGEVGQLMQNQQPGQNAMPIPLIGDKGKGVLWVHMPRGGNVQVRPGTTPGDEMLGIAINFSVLLPSGEEVFLVDPSKVTSGWGGGGGGNGPGGTQPPDRQNLPSPEDSGAGKPKPGGV